MLIIPQYTLSVSVGLYKESSGIKINSKSGFILKRCRIKEIDLLLEEVEEGEEGEEVGEEGEEGEKEGKKEKGKKASVAEKAQQYLKSKISIPVQIQIQTRKRKRDERKEQEEGKKEEKEEKEEKEKQVTKKIRVNCNGKEMPWFIPKEMTTRNLQKLLDQKCLLKDPMKPLPQQIIFEQDLYSLYEQQLKKGKKGFGSYLLYWGMGRGKTMAVFYGLRRLLSLTKILIICPNSTLYQWKEHAERTLEEQETEERTFLIVGYSEFKRLLSEEPEFKIQEWSIILDEAHHFRNITPNMEYEIQELRKAASLLLLTGTPLQNSAGELDWLYYLMKMEQILTPQEQKIMLLVKDNEENIAKIVPLLKKALKGRVSFYQGEKEKVDLETRLQEKIIKVPQTLEQTLEYILCKKKNTTFLDVTVQTSRRNCCNVLSRRVLNFHESVETSPKFQAILQQIQLYPQRFPQFTFSKYKVLGVEKIQEMLEKQGYRKVAMIVGDVSSEKRAGIMKLYNSGALDHLIVSNAAKEGIDLKKTRLLHNMEQQDNLYERKQLISRCRRFGSHTELDEADRDLLVLDYIGVFPEFKKTEEKQNDQRIKDYFLTRYNIDFSEGEKKGSGVFVKELQRIIKEECGGETDDERMYKNNFIKAKLLEPLLETLEKVGDIHDRVQVLEQVEEEKKKREKVEQEKKLQDKQARSEKKELKKQRDLKIKALLTALSQE